MASSTLSAGKVVLLASHFATHADIDSLSSLTAQHGTVLRKHLLLRILLTYLPETLDPTRYVNFLQTLATSEASDAPGGGYETTFVDDLSDEQASKKARKLHLLQLSRPGSLKDVDADPLTIFLFLRAYRMDEEAGMLARVPDLLTPFLDHNPILGNWLVSTVRPLLRRNCEYYPQQPSQYTLQEFQDLPDREAVDYLLANTGDQNEDHGLLDRDLRGLVGPWLYNDGRWKHSSAVDGSLDQSDEKAVLVCPGWEQVLNWLVSQASKSWRTAYQVVEQWDGPQDVDLGHGVSLWLRDSQQQYLDQTYARAALASVYSIQESTVEALEGTFEISNKIRYMLDQDSDSSLNPALSNLSPVPDFDADDLSGAKAASFLRGDLLNASNLLTTPNSTSIDLLIALIRSALLLTRAGVPCSIRKAGDFAFLQDAREQKGELARLLRAISGRAPKNDDEYWVRSREEVLWLHAWGRGAGSQQSIKGLFGRLSAEYVETELLKALLSDMRYDLARSIYEDAPDHLLDLSVIQNTVQTSALNAFDNASNPNRTRGGLKKCDDIIHAFPKTMGKSLPATMRIEALLRATHALSDYRLVLKQGEPFSPVVLRVHSDPIFIIEKVLEQNPQAYTRLQEFLEMGTNMVKAGLITRSELEKQTKKADQSDEISRVEKRITAMTIVAALREDDFETAYSYVVSRLGRAHESSMSSMSKSFHDEWSWNAALEAGKYVRTERSQKPTHLGTSSGNLEIRHLGQRIECLATALRIAPAARLQEVLKTFRRCEEQLDSAIKEEAAKEDAWDAAADLRDIPGAFDARDPDTAYPSRNMTASAVARQAEEAPMSLFDLSRATARVAQRNFTALSSLQGMTQGLSQGASQGTSQAHSQSQVSDTETSDSQRLRKRDQLREAATGTIVSGVGWLIGANMNRGGNNEQQ